MMFYSYFILSLLYLFQIGEKGPSANADLISTYAALLRMDDLTYLNKDNQTISKK
jgi:cell division protein ZapA (FtsZ GTPase activity inhibitor)